MGEDVQAADEAGQLITGRRLIANFLSVLPLLEQAAHRAAHKSARERRAVKIAASYATTIDKAWTIMLLEQLCETQNTAEAKRRREKHYKDWRRKVDELNSTQEGRRQLARRAHWSDLRWNGDDIAYVNVMYPGYRGE
jgi:hypothetical protein